MEHSYFSGNLRVFICHLLIQEILKTHMGTWVRRGFCVTSWHKYHIVSFACTLASVSFLVHWFAKPYSQSEWFLSLMAPTLIRLAASAKKPLAQSNDHQRCGTDLGCRRSKMAQLDRQPTVGLVRPGLKGLNPDLFLCSKVFLHVKTKYVS